MIIDFHCHIGRSKIFSGGSGTAKDLVNLMDKRKIDKVVLLPSASPRKPRYYEDALDAYKEFPDRFFPFFLANPREENVCDMLEMVVEKYGFKGLKMHPTFLGVAADDKEWVYPIAEKARELKILHDDSFRPIALCYALANRASGHGLSRYSRRDGSHGIRGCNL